MTYTKINGEVVDNSSALAAVLTDLQVTKEADLPRVQGAVSGFDRDGDLSFAVPIDFDRFAMAHFYRGEWFATIEMHRDVALLGLTEIRLFSEPEVAEFEGGGVRSSDEDKPDFSLLFVTDLDYEDQVLTKAAKRMQDGAKLYGRLNHEQMNSREALDRCKASLLRHVVQYLNGETDEEHLAAVVCNAVMVSGIEKRIDNAVDS